MSTIPMSVIRVQQADVELINSLRHPTESLAECLHRILGQRGSYGQQSVADVRQVLEANGGRPVKRCVIASKSGWSGTTVDRALRALNAIQTRQGWRLPEPAQTQENR